MKETSIVIRMEEDLKKKLQMLADRDQRTLSDFIRVNLKKLTEKS
jgi:predicted transcriptional regulator